MGLEGIGYSVKQTQDALKDILTVYLKTTLEVISDRLGIDATKVKFYIEHSHGGGYSVEIRLNKKDLDKEKNDNFFRHLIEEFGQNNYRKYSMEEGEAYYQTETYQTLMQAVKSIAKVNQLGITAALEEHKSVGKPLQTTQPEAADQDPSVKRARPQYTGVLAFYRS